MSDANLIPVLPAVTAFLGREHGLFIDGRTVPAQSGDRQAVYGPATGEVIAHVADGDAGDVDRAVQSAHAAFRSGAWTGLRPAERERILLRFADVVEAHAEALAQLETLNQGKSINLSRMIEVGASIEYMRYMAGWATKIEGQTLDVSIPVPPGTRYTAYTRREPVGVVAGIVPWNFPLMIAIWKVLPALACGCTVVIKPSQETPLTALYLAGLAAEAGVPPGVFNVVTGRGSRAGDALTRHPRVSKISFTGSTAVGKQVATAAIDNLARFALELGGKNPMVVLADADVDQVVQGALLGGFLNQGQVCAAASRLYVQRRRYDAVVEALGAAVAGLSVGPGLDPGAQINALVSAKQQQSVGRYLEIGRAEGARVVAGGRVLDRPGYFVEPTLLAGMRQDMTLVREEVFGPVLVALPFDDVDEVVRMANDSPYGLTASVWTNDLKAAMNLVPRIEAGTVWVNSHVPVDPNLPFGGYKQSGIGREFGRSAIEAYTEIKSVCIAH
ncbi:phenylacetaldehyde dehydrogenase [Plasticicumulans lactativorans]|uniref:Phenylacetaldehyde dehydrogenase n=1 Tax=Plasticicumulans lactativorans TaxID=1133106 RepID=A0A4R2L8C4_9GAMM|nr:aldehyde dehydrogenase family protein [Plasticicumulans lactativorans]TCO83816.1 phenylacetaldehyde dehydrogenase [Plasticicumulans lactativorans]